MASIKVSSISLSHRKRPRLSLLCESYLARSTQAPPLLFYRAPRSNHSIPFHGHNLLSLSFFLSLSERGKRRWEMMALSNQLDSLPRSIIKHCNLEMKLRLEFFTLPKITFQRVEQREAIVILTCFEKKCQNVPEFLASKS